MDFSNGMPQYIDSESHMGDVTTIKCHDQLQFFRLSLVEAVTDDAKERKQPEKATEAIFW